MGGRRAPSPGSPGGGGTKPVRPGYLQQEAHVGRGVGCGLGRAKPGTAGLNRREGEGARRTHGYGAAADFSGFSSSSGRRRSGRGRPGLVWLSRLEAELPGKRRPPRPPRQLRAPSERSRESSGAPPTPESPSGHLGSRRWPAQPWSLRQHVAPGHGPASRAARLRSEPRREANIHSSLGFCREGPSLHQGLPSKDSGRP